jgi:hypothetical protein
VPPQPRDVGWWRIMALYYLPQADIVSVQICNACPAKSGIVAHAP